MRRDRTRLKRRTFSQIHRLGRRLSAEEDEEGIEDWMVAGRQPVSLNRKWFVNCHHGNHAGVVA